MSKIDQSSASSDNASLLPVLCPLPTDVIFPTFPLAEFLIFQLHCDPSTEVQDSYTTAVYYL